MTDIVERLWTSANLCEFNGPLVREAADEIERLQALSDQLGGALQFILAFYEPGQRYLDTEAWKRAEASGRAAHAAWLVKP